MKPALPSHRPPTRRWGSAAKLAACALALTLCVSCASGTDTADQPSPQDSQAAPTVEESTEAGIPQQAYVAPDEAEALVKDGAVVLDLRNRYDYAAAHIKTARNVAPGKALQVEAERLSKSETYLLVSGNPDHETKAWQTLMEAGMSPDNVKIIEGGMDSWIDAGLPAKTTEVIGC